MMNYWGASRHRINRLLISWEIYILIFYEFLVSSMIKKAENDSVRLSLFEKRCQSCAVWINLFFFGHQLFFFTLSWLPYIYDRWSSFFKLDDAPRPIEFCIFFICCTFFSFEFWIIHLTLCKVEFVKLVLCYDLTNISINFWEFFIKLLFFWNRFDNKFGFWRKKFPKIEKHSILIFQMFFPRNDEIGNFTNVITTTSQNANLQQATPLATNWC